MHWDMAAYWIVWLLNCLLQWVLVALIVRDKTWKKLPAFALYVSFCCLKTSILIVVMLLVRSAYITINWGTRLIGLPLMIAVLIEVFAAVFRPYSTLPKGTLRWFRIAFTCLIVVTATVSFWFPVSVPGNRVGTLLLMLNRSTSIIFCGAFVFTAISSAYFGIPWRTRIYGIGAGFLLFISVDLFASSLMAINDIAVAQVLNVVTMLSFTLALITWIIYFCKEDVSVTVPSLEQLRRLQKSLEYATERMESIREIG